jgi:ABC-2 type transport system ATP-binding protein
MMVIKTRKKGPGGDAEVDGVVLESVSKNYAGRAVLEEVSMTVRPGTVTALIGRNGSGKSTLLSILAGLIHASSGVVRREADMVIGYAPEAFPGLKLTPEQYLRSMGRIRGISMERIEGRMVELLECFQLTPFRSQPMISFSKGMLQKINLIQSLLIQPNLLLLDEPMSGLDLPAQNTLVQLLHELKHKGAAVVFSVHEPQWIEALADSLHILQAGRTVRTVQGGAGDWMDRPSTSIVFTNLEHKKLLAWTDLPGFISLQDVAKSRGSASLELIVESAYSDHYLHRVLDLNGSIVSVEPRGGWSELEQWMNQKPSQGGTGA